MITDGIRNRSFDRIVVWKLSRFARSREANAVYKSRLAKAKIKVVSINEPNDGSPNGMLMEGIVEVMDEFYSANLSQEVRRGTRRLAEGGFFMGSTPAYGYRIIDVMDGDRRRHKLDLDPLTAPIARRIWNMALDGVTVHKIMRTFNQEKIPTAKGGRWISGSLQRILKNEHYVGTIVRGLEGSQNDEPIRTPNSHPVIVSQEEYDRVQVILAQRAPQPSNPNVMHPRQIGSKHLLSGLASCNLCGEKMTHKNGDSGRNTCIYCPKYLQQDPRECHCPPRNTRHFESKFMDALMDDILTEPNIRSLIDQIKTETDRTQSD